MGNEPSVIKNNQYGFNEKTTAGEVVQYFNKTGNNLAGKTIFITGCTNGIGRETAKALAKIAGAPTLVFANRNLEASKTLQEEIERENDRATPKIHHLKLDLSSFEAVNQCVDSFKQLQLPLNYLVLNAGIFSGSFSLTQDGFESHLGINHLGHFLLTHKLLQELAESGTVESPSRVVVVASHSHLMVSDLNIERLQLTEKDFQGLLPSQVGYAQSKLCNVLFSKELDRIAKENNLHICSYSLHPATMVASNIGNDSLLARAAIHVASLFTRSLPQAAATSLFCTLAPELIQDEWRGRYFDKCNCVANAKLADNESLARQLWEESERLCKLESLYTRLKESS